MSYNKTYRVDNGESTTNYSIALPPNMNPANFDNNYNGGNAIQPQDKRLRHFQEFLVDWKKSQPDNCCICLDTNPGVNNDLLFCASPNCDVCVHQECYGVRVSPSQDEAWYCDRCRIPEGHNMFCRLCPIKRGAIKKVMDSSSWVHIVCALWWPQVKVLDDNNGLQIMSINDIPPQCYSQACVLCENQNDQRNGACIRCDYGGCQNFFHITCAQELDLLEECTDLSRLRPGEEPYYAYCRTHGRSQNPHLNPWALWSRKKDTFYESLCKTNLELVESVQEREKPVSMMRERRKSIQHNGLVLPPINNVGTLNPVMEGPSVKEDEEIPVPQTGLVEKFEKAYTIYDKERERFIRNADMSFSVESNLNRNLLKKIEQSSEFTGNLHKEQQHLEQLNRNLKLEVSELKYGLINLCSQKGLAMVQKLMGRPKDGLEFYPHHTRVLDYFLQVAHLIAKSRANSPQYLPPRTCICNVCNNPVDFSLATTSCRLCGSWYHMPCLPPLVRPFDCSENWLCRSCHRGDPIIKNRLEPAQSEESNPNSPNPNESHPNSATFPPNPNASNSTQNLDPKSMLKNHPMSTTPNIDSQQAKKRAVGNELPPHPTHLSSRVNSNKKNGSPTPNPGTKLPEELVTAYQQTPRFPGDEYTPRWVRGVGKYKEGLCPHCPDRQVWLKIKISAYWYHLNYQHGISSITGKPFRKPLELRHNPERDLQEALCHKCKNWIPNESPRNKPVNVEEIYWWKHAQKCHQ